MQEKRVEEIRNLIAKYGWNYIYKEPGTFETGWQVKTKKFRLLITGSNSFICFSVCLLRLYDLTLYRQELVLKVLNNFNNRSYFVRGYINSNHEFLLCADIFSQNKVKYNDFRLALSLLTYYSNHLYRELGKVIKKPQSIGSFKEF